MMLTRLIALGLSLVAAAVSADSLLDLRKEESQFISDLAALSHIAYSENYSDIERELRDSGWSLVNGPGGMVNSRSGLKLKVFERTDSSTGITTRVIAFAGTDLSTKDWLNNFAQGLDMGYMSREHASQYREARAFVASQITEADSRADLRLAVTGHSLGGGIAQYVSILFGLRGAVFDAAPLSIGSLARDLPDYLGDAAMTRLALSRTNLYNVHLFGDPVHELPGIQAGRQFMIMPLAGSDHIDASYRGGLTKDFYHRHSMGLLRDSIVSLIATGVEPQSYNNSISVKRITLESFSEDLLAGYKALRAIEDLPKVYDAWLLGSRNLKYFDDATKTPVAESWSLLLDFQSALRQDLDNVNDGTYTILSSHSLELLFRIGFREMLRREILSDLQQLGKIRGSFVRNFGYLGHGEDDFVAGIARMVGSGRWDDIEGVTMALSGFNRFIWAAVGYHISGGNSAVAELFERIADASARLGRRLTLNTFIRYYAAGTGVDRQLVKAYIEAQELRLTEGLEAQTIEEFWDYDPTIMIQIGKSGLTAANARYNLTSPTKIKSARAPRVLTSTRHERYREVCIHGYCTRTNLSDYGVRRSHRSTQETSVLEKIENSRESKTAQEECQENDENCGAPDNTTASIIYYCPDGTSPPCGPPPLVGTCPDGSTPPCSDRGSCPDGTSPPCGNSDSCPDGTSPPCRPPSTLSKQLYKNLNQPPYVRALEPFSRTTPDVNGVLMPTEVVRDQPLDTNDFFRPSD